MKPAPKTAEATLQHVSSAQLAALPKPLRLRHGPLMVTVERWSDGTVVARLPAARLYAYAETDGDAIHELGDEIAETVQRLVKLRAAGTRFGGAIAQT